MISLPRASLHLLTASRIAARKSRCSGSDAPIGFGKVCVMPTPRAAVSPATLDTRPAGRYESAKIDCETPAWKAPLWQWVKRLRAWPFTSEALAGAFDYNHAPYLQSFVEVRVEPSADRLRLLPWGPHGRLQWAELQSSPGWRPADRRPDEPVEIVVPIRRRGAPAR